ncbi:hypothetical protein ApDm4_1416 [Acetobacter pomorum]|nr:hypothetical protein ApDm4_1416 [Acetobacter pomorum]
MNWKGEQMMEARLKIFLFLFLCLWCILMEYIVLYQEYTRRLT